MMMIMILLIVIVTIVPISVTLVGIVTDSSDAHAWKAP
jgi:hypothetical protein